MSKQTSRVELPDFRLTLPASKLVAYFMAQHIHLSFVIRLSPRRRAGEEVLFGFNARKKAEKDLFTFSMYVLWHRSRWKKCSAR
jgi:hypothetical protein